MNSSRCIFCFEDAEELIQLHECIDHHAHLSCLDIYREQYKSILCPLCSHSISKNVLDLLNFTLRISDASMISRIDLLKRRLNLPVHDRELEDGLYCIIRKNQIEFLQAVLTFIADTKNLSVDLFSIYSFALEFGRVQCAQMILQEVVEKRIFRDSEILVRFFLASVSDNGMELVETILHSKVQERFRTAIVDSFCSIYNFFGKKDHENLSRFLDNLTLDELDSCLKFAAEAGNLDCCKLLVSKGASARRADVEHKILSVCVAKDDWLALYSFSELGLDITIDDFFVLGCEIANGSWNFVEFLMTMGNCTSIGLSKSLPHVVRKNDVIGVKTLLDLGALADFNKSQALLTALKCDLQPIVKLLLQRGANVGDVKDHLVRPKEELWSLYYSELRPKIRLSPFYNVRVLFCSTAFNFI